MQPRMANETAGSTASWAAKVNASAKRVAVAQLSESMGVSVLVLVMMSALAMAACVNIRAPWRQRRPEEAPLMDWLDWTTLELCLLTLPARCQPKRWSVGCVEIRPRS